MKAIRVLLAIGLPPLFALAQQDVLASLATDFSGRREPVRCQPADTNWFTPPGQRLCVWVEGNISWAPAELTAQGASGGPLDLLVWAMQRRDSADVNQLRDSLNTAFTTRGLQHYACRGGAHRWQGPGLAVEFHGGAKDSTGTFRTLVSAMRNSAELPKIYCKDVPDVPFEASTVTEDNRLAIRDLIDFQIFASYRERATSASPYTSDAVLMVGKSRYPLGTRTNNTEVSVWRDVTTRCRRPSEQGRPLVTKVAFLEESDSSAHVKISGTFTSFANQEIPSAVTNLKNEGWFVKQGGEWKISRWQIYPDLTGCSK